ncbi:bleomycin resistance family protein [Spirosoma aureum]|uniref:Bleomycin resistance family protein n=1 Tax=Spirosoma aureum TaxID=2692134 RepID=A0A6G9ARP8_9BACT|nr:VOC family protein [Spirosoma aureum]QIP14999.1 bleomycin resistance family protein [Spirosoma aureum]
MKLANTVPILYSANVTRSLAYYIDVLGFDDKWEWENPPTFGGVVKNDVEIFFCLNGQGHPETWVCLVIDDVDAYYETIKAKGALDVSPPERMPWNMREMFVKDPDGHILRIGHRIECNPAA